jgi:hypothetical protein
MVQPTETVSRPDPGLARGTWEAPPWAFWAMLAVVLAAAALYLLWRTGRLRRKSSAPTTEPRPKA